jgi:sec-independent protein translocase protein TatB
LPVGFSELIVLFVIGLLILGPERLPRVATQIGRWVGKARRTANQLRYQLEREIALADLEEKKKDRDKPGPDVSASKPTDAPAEPEPPKPAESPAAEAATTASPDSPPPNAASAPRNEEPKA